MRVGNSDVVAPVSYGSPTYPQETPSFENECLLSEDGSNHTLDLFLPAVSAVPACDVTSKTVVEEELHLGCRARIMVQNRSCQRNDLLGVFSTVVRAPSRDSYQLIVLDSGCTV